MFSNENIQFSESYPPTPKSSKKAPAGLLKNANKKKSKFSKFQTTCAP